MEALGIDPKILLTQVINFGIVLFLLSKFLYKPILKVLGERKKKIAEGLAWTEKAKVEEERLKERKQEMTKEARDEAKIILENAKKDAKHVREEIIADGKKEVAQLKEKMEKESDAKLEEATAALAARTVDIAVAMIRQVLPSVLSESQQHALIKEQLKKIQARHETKK